MHYQTTIDHFIIRDATPKDCLQIVRFIEELALFEKFENLLTLTAEQIHDTLFIKKQAYCLIGEQNDFPVCFAIYFHNYSILTARANMHIEALFTPEKYRSRGYGSALMRCIAQIAELKGCKRIDWACLKWNTRAIAFYRSIGAYPLDDRDTYRMDADSIHNLASC